jgi:hypothetical protein
MLHTRLPGHRRTDQVVAQHEIRGCAEIPNRHNAQQGHAQSSDPGAHGDMANGFAARENDGVGLFLAFAEYTAVLPVRHAIFLVRTGLYEWLTAITPR